MKFLKFLEWLESSLLATRDHDGIIDILEIIDIFEIIDIIEIIEIIRTIGIIGVIEYPDTIGLISQAHINVRVRRGTPAEAQRAPR